jgi:hypothetical protein
MLQQASSTAPRRWHLLMSRSDVKLICDADGVAPSLPAQISEH